jgi:AcrR family transcriptional regulator
MTELHSDRRRRLMRDELRSIAVDLFAERGFDEVTVDDIAAAAGISARTFFRYFATKDEVVLAYERRLHERLLTALHSRPANEGGVEALREAYIATSHVDPADRAKVLLLGRILLQASALRARALGERLAEDQALISDIAGRLGVKAGDARARVVVAAMSAVAVTEFRVWVDDNGKGDPAVRISTALAMIESGLSRLDDLQQPRRTK